MPPSRSTTTAYTGPPPNIVAPPYINNNTATPSPVNTTTSPRSHLWATTTAYTRPPHNTVAPSYTNNNPLCCHLISAVTNKATDNGSGSAIVVKENKDFETKVIEDDALGNGAPEADRWLNLKIQNMLLELGT